MIIYIIPSPRQPCSDGYTNHIALFNRTESSLNDLEVTEHLIMRYELSCLAVDSGGKVSVVVVYIGLRTRDTVGIGRYLIAGSHRLGKTCCGLYGNDVALMPVLALDDLGLLSPVGDESRALLGAHVETGHCDEVVGSDLAVSLCSVVEIQGKLKAVVDLLIGNVVKCAVNALDLAGEQLHKLVDEVDTPVVEHSAAVLKLTSPVGGDTARAVNAGLDIKYLSELAGGSGER